MGPEGLDVLWVLLCWAVLFLLVPKRGWRTLAIRRQLVRTGNRLHVLGPPGVVGVSQQDASLRRLRNQFGAEWWRLLELGVVIWVLALAAENRGRARRQERLASWQRGPTGLLWRCLQGEMVFPGRMEEAAAAELGCALAPKATRQLRPQYVVPPMAWLREGETRPAQPTASRELFFQPGGESEEPPRQTPGLQVQTLGTLRVTTAAEDLTAGLLKRPTLAFIWQYLLVRALLNLRPGVHRDALADELYPGVDLSQQRKRLSHRIYDLQKFMKPELLAPIAIGDLELGFRIDRCRIDVARIFELAEETKKTEGLLVRSLVQELSDLLAVASEEFLPDWEDLEQAVTEGRGTSGDLVRQLRQRLEEARVTLLATLGDHHLAARNPGQAVLALEEAYELRPERLDVVSKLIDALEAGGQQGRAKELRRRGLERDQLA